MLRFIGRLGMAAVATAFGRGKLGEYSRMATTSKPDFSMVCTTSADRSSEIALGP